MQFKTFYGMWTTFLKILTLKGNGNLKTNFMTKKIVQEPFYALLDKGC